MSKKHAPRRAARPAARVKLRVYIGDVHSLGPGKVQLLEAVGELRSISAAARSMQMAYRHAWSLIAAMNECFGAPVVETTTGGRRGGGATVTPLGERLVRRFRAMERKVETRLRSDLDALAAAVRTDRTRGI